MLSTIVHKLRAAEEKNHLYLKEIEELFTKQSFGKKQSWAGRLNFCCNILITFIYIMISHEALKMEILSCSFAVCPNLLIYFLRLIIQIMPGGWLNFTILC